MASSSDRVFSIVTDTVNVGLSTVIGISYMPGQCALQIKHRSGGSLMLGGQVNFAGATFNWTNGYLFSVGEALSFDTGGNVYLRAVGATVICDVLRTLTVGY